LQSVFPVFERYGARIDELHGGLALQCCQASTHRQDRRKKYVRCRAMVWDTVRMPNVYLGVHASQTF
jgi:hypothetical protein